MSRNGPTAFVDESYKSHASEPSFYLLGGVLVDRALVDYTRGRALEVAQRSGLGVFHAKKAWREGERGEWAIQQMLCLVSECATFTVVVASMSVPSTLEDARQACLRRLLRRVEERKVRTLVLDSRGSRRERRTYGSARPDRIDRRTYAELVGERALVGTMSMRHEDDEREPLLWLPDAVAWAARRTVAVGDMRWWRCVRQRANVIDAYSGEATTLPP